MTPVRTTAPQGSLFQVTASGGGELTLHVVSSFVPSQVQVELPPGTQFNLTTHNAGVQQFSAGPGPGNAIITQPLLPGLTFFTLADNTAGDCLFEQT